MTEVLEKAQELIKSRLTEIEAQQSRLRGAMQELRGTDSTARQPRPAARKQTRRGRKPRRRRMAREQREAQLLERVGENPHATNIQLAQSLGVSPNYISQMVGAMSKRGTLKREDGRFTVR